MAQHSQDHGPIVWTVFAASFGFALIQLDVTIVNVALPRIGQELNAPVALLQWVVDSYALCFAALLLSAGFLGDRFGARKVYQGGLILFGLASVACGLAPTGGFLIAARALQGVGAAAMLPTSLALLNHASGHDGKLRAKAVGWWTASGSITIAAGPIVGGLLLGAAGWRSIFLVNLPICIIAALQTLRVEETETKAQDGFDVSGQILAIIALAALTAAVIEAKPLGLASLFVWMLALIGIVATVGFLLVEARSPHPMLPLGLFKNSTFSVAVVYGVIANLTYYGIIFVLSLYLQNVLGYGPVKAGLAYLPLTATFFVVNIFSGWWTGLVGSRQPMVVGALIDAAGFALLLLLGAESPYAMMLPAFALLPAGMGLGVPAMTSAVLASVEKRMSGLAAGVLNAARQAGGAVGVALFGALGGEQGAGIVTGLHVSSTIAVAALMIAALIAFAGVSGKPHA
jgi:MFS transporter, DHA2 family, methylenomycin A resistance protein